MTTIKYQNVFGVRTVRKLLPFLHNKQTGFDDEVWFGHYPVAEAVTI